MSLTCPMFNCAICWKIKHLVRTTTSGYRSITPATYQLNVHGRGSLIYMQPASSKWLPVVRLKQLLWFCGWICGRCIEHINCRCSIFTNFVYFTPSNCWCVWSSNWWNESLMYIVKVLPLTSALNRYWSSSNTQIRTCAHTDSAYYLLSFSLLLPVPYHILTSLHLLSGVVWRSPDPHLARLPRAQIYIL